MCTILFHSTHETFELSKRTFGDSKGKQRCVTQALLRLIRKKSRARCSWNKGGTSLALQIYILEVQIFLIDSLMHL